MNNKKRRNARNKARAEALCEMAATLQLDLSSPEYDDLRMALEHVAHSGLTSIPEPGETIEDIDGSDFLAEDIPTPTHSSVVGVATLPVAMDGNIFVVCAGCASMLLLATGQERLPLPTADYLANIIAFSYCRSCGRRGLTWKKQGLTLSPVLFDNSRLVKIPGLILGQAVSIYTENSYVVCWDLDTLLLKAGPDVKAFSIRTDADIDAGNPPQSLLLPYLERCFL